MGPGFEENFCILHFLWNSLSLRAFGSIFKKAIGRK
ncbi:hypothetical protein FHX15_002094 [Rhizobium sp. BK650]|nr:hypothetical protein [Rhizobium sp. BK650]